MTSDLVIKVNDFRAAGVCPKARHWFIRHGLDWRGFVKDGIELQKLRDTGEHQTTVDLVEAAARRRLNG